MSTAVAGNATHAAQKATSDRAITHGSVSSGAFAPRILRQAIALPQRGELRARRGGVGARQGERDGVDAARLLPLEGGGTRLAGSGERLALVAVGMADVRSGLHQADAVARAAVERAGAAEFAPRRLVLAAARQD